MLKTLYEKRPSILSNPPEASAKVTLRVELYSDVLGKIPEKDALKIIKNNLDIVAEGATIIPAYGVYKDTIHKSLYIEIILTPIYQQKTFTRFIKDIESFVAILLMEFQQWEILGEITSPTDMHYRSVYPFNLEKQELLQPKYDKVLVR